MPINVKISLCKITRASKLFQRNYYLPLLKPLSPKDALRRKIITGQNVLGNRIEHYIPTLETYEERMGRRRRRVKGVPIIKKRVRMNSRMRYVVPFLDDDMENHNILKRIISKKPRGKGQHYIYEVFDKACALVLPFQFERAIRDKDIIDVVMAQRSEKIVIKVNNGTKITLPLASFEGHTPLYRGSGWTREVTEEEHHHGKETFSLAKLFEAKEQGVEEWELEMMRLANKRKKKLKGEDSGDWKEMLAGCLESMDWDKFEEDTKQILEEKDEIVEGEDIPMAVDDMEKTKHVNEKLKQGGEEVLSQLPTMIEVPEVIKTLDKGEMCELLQVSGMRISLESGKSCFVAGQMVKDDDEKEMFVPGQTIEDAEGNTEYTPGITVCMDDEPTLIPGLVMGEDHTGAMFLPGDSTITKEGQLQFEATEEDLPPKPASPSPEEESPSSSSRSPSPEPMPKPKVKKPEQPIVIKRRVIEEQQPVKKEKTKKRPPPTIVKEKTPPKIVPRVSRLPLVDPLKLLSEQLQKEQEESKKRLKEQAEERKRKEERKVDQLRLEIRQKYRNMKFETPPPYKPVEPVKKSRQLEELEQSISQGTFFENEHTKKIMDNLRNSTRHSRYTNNLNSYVGYGFAKYNFVDFGSLYLGVDRSYRIMVH